MAKSQEAIDIARAKRSKYHIAQKRLDELDQRCDEFYDNVLSYQKASDEQREMISEAQVILEQARSKYERQHDKLAKRLDRLSGQIKKYQRTHNARREKELRHERNQLLAAIGTLDKPDEEREALNEAFNRLKAIKKPLTCAVSSYKSAEYEWTRQSEAVEAARLEYFEASKHPAHAFYFLEYLKNSYTLYGREFKDYIFSIRTRKDGSVWVMFVPFGMKPSETEAQGKALFDAEGHLRYLRASNQKPGQYLYKSQKKG